MPEERDDAQRKREPGRSGGSVGDDTADESSADDEDGDDVIGQGAEERVTQDDFEIALGDIDASLLDELDDDTRYASSVEPALRRDDLDFIQMTGLTAPASHAEVPDAVEEDAGEADRLDPSAPIRFAESGVEDVDFAQDPFANGDDTLALDDAHEFVPERPPVRRPAPRPSNVLSDLSAIVKELETTEKTEDAANTESTQAIDAEPETVDVDVAEDAEETEIPQPLNVDVQNEVAAAADADRSARSALTALTADDALEDDVIAWDDDPENFLDDAETDEVGAEAVNEVSEPEPVVEFAIETRGTEVLDAQDVLDLEPETPSSEAPQEDSEGGNLEDIVRRLEGEIVARKTRTPEVAEYLRRVRHQEAEQSRPEPDTLADTVIIESEAVAPVVDESVDEPSDARAEEPEPRGFFQPIRTPLAPPSAELIETEIDGPDDPWPLDGSAEFDSGDLGPTDRSRRNRRAPARLLLAALAVMGIAGLGAAAYFGRTYLGAATLNDPHAAFSQAETRLKRGQSAEDFAAASAAFLRIHEDHPSHDLGAPSLFNAAYALYSTPEAPRGPAVEAYQRAAVLFEDFIAQYPEHEKVGRAHSLVARLLYETGDYQGAIDRISDPLQRERDPGGYLGSLRIRANAYDALDNIDAAAADLHAAAGHPDNYTPHKDYVALAEMYRTRARTETNPAKRRDYQQRVIEELQRAQNLHGLDRDERRAITNQIQAETSLLAASLQSGANPAGAAPSAVVITPGESAIPVRADTLDTWRPAAASESEDESAQ